MEAVALYDFQKSSEDELTFTKGNILKVCVCVFCVCIIHSVLLACILYNTCNLQYALIYKIYNRYIYTGTHTHKRHSLEYNLSQYT